LQPWELVEVWEKRHYSEGSFFWRERRRWRFAWREKETRASLCFGLLLEKALAVFFGRRMPEWVSIPARWNFRGP
jgi:hypothetical protein